MTSWNACTAMMKTDVNNKHVPFKKTRMTIEGRSNIQPMMASLGLRFGSDDRDIRIISILDFHVIAIVAKSRETQHIPRIVWVCAFLCKKYRNEFLRAYSSCFIRFQKIS